MREVAPKNTIVSSQTHKDNRLDNLRRDKDKSAPSEKDELEAASPVKPQEHHFISPSVRNKIRLSSWLVENQDDPALKVSLCYQSDRQF